MRTRWAHVVLLSLAVSATPLPGPAQTPGAPPDSYRHVARDVAPGDRYDISCTGATTEANGAYVVFFVIGPRSGNGIFNGQGEGGFGHGRPAVTIHVAEDAVHAPLPVPGLDTLPVQEWAGTAVNEAKLRVVWATWEMTFDCSVTVNGVAVASTALDPAKAVMARLRDFTGGASVDTEIAAAGAQLTFERDVDGFVYSWLWADGLERNEGPDDAYARDKHFFWVGRSNGTWTHSIDAGAAAPSARGFILETPL